jgi:hypothetical protein
MDKGKEAAIIMFAMPKKPGMGVTPPTEALKKKNGILPEMSDSESEVEETSKPDKCEECDGEGCAECDMKGYVEQEDEGEEEGDEEPASLKAIAKLIQMLDK